MKNKEPRSLMPMNNSTKQAWMTTTAHLLQPPTNNDHPPWHEMGMTTHKQQQLHALKTNELTRSTHLNHSRTTTAHHTKLARLPTNDLPMTWNIHPNHPHWGACSAPQLPFPWPSNPHKAAWQCQLTLALLLQGSLVMSGAINPCGLGYPWVFVNPWPIPVKTRACGCGYGFWWVQAQVTLENPRGVGIKPRDHMHHNYDTCCVYTSQHSYVNMCT